MAPDKIILQVVPDDDPRLEDNTPDSWHQVRDIPTFVKWRYKESPYYVIATLNEDRGHWEALFTTSFCRSPNALIRGNLGGGKTGRRKAIAASNQFIAENKYGCPPPGEIDL